MANKIVLLVVAVVHFCAIVYGQQLICENRRPEGYTVSKTEGDGGFQVIVVGPESTKGRYVPNEVYTGKLLLALFRRWVWAHSK